MWCLAAFGLTNMRYALHGVLGLVFFYQWYFLFASLCVCVCVGVWTCSCGYVLVGICAHVCMCVGMDLFTWVCVCRYMCTCVLVEARVLSYVLLLMSCPCFFPDRVFYWNWSSPIVWTSGFQPVGLNLLGVKPPFYRGRISDILHIRYLHHDS